LVVSIEVAFQNKGGESMLYSVAQVVLVALLLRRAGLYVEEKAHKLKNVQAWNAGGDLCVASTAGSESSWLGEERHTAASPGSEAVLGSASGAGTHLTRREEEALAPGPLPGGLSTPAAAGLQEAERGLGRKSCLILSSVHSGAGGLVGTAW
jgi:hypothetical protein